MKWNKEVQMLLILVIVLAVAPIAYVTLFTAQVFNFINKPGDDVVKLQAYNTQEECLQVEEVECELITTDTEEDYWITSNR